MISFFEEIRVLSEQVSRTNIESKRTQQYIILFRLILFFYRGIREVICLPVNRLF